MRPVIAMLALLLALSACTIREETFAPKDEGQSNAFSFGAREMNGPAERDSSSCPGGFARGSDMQAYRGGSQDLFCN